MQIFDNLPGAKRTMFVLALVLVHFSAFSQYKETPYRNANFYFGIEGMMGTKTFDVKSNIPEINGLKTIEEGFSLGLLTGGKLALVKLRTGFFKPSTSMVEKLTLRNFELHVNTFPLELLKRQNKFFRPYLTAGFDRSQLRFFGNYALPLPPPPPPANPPCDPDAVGDAPMPQDTPVAQKPQEQGPESTLLGKVNVVRGFGGSGLAIHVPGKNHFLNFFMEAQYGFTLSTKATSPEFDNTTVKGQMSLNAGISLGIRR